MTGSTRTGLRLTGMLALVLAGGCVQLNAEHCANQNGDATCAERDLMRPNCSICFESGGENGCTAEVVPLACRPEGSTAASSTEVGPASSGPEDTAVEPGTGPGTSSGTPADSDSTTASSVTEGGASETSVEPYCGDGVLNNQGEACDGEDFGGSTCNNLSMGVGVLQCTDDCMVDTSGCCFPQNSSCMSNDDCCSLDCMGLLPMVTPGTCA